MALERPVVGPDLSPTATPRPRPGGGRRPPADELGRPLQRHAPVAVGRRVAGDERVAGPGQVPQPELHRIDAEDLRRLVHVRFDRPDLLGIAEAAERRGGHGVRQDAAREDPHRGDGVRPVRAEAALADRPVGDVGIGADEVVRADVAKDDRPVGRGSRSGRGRSMRRAGRPGTSPRATARAGRDGRCGARGRPRAARTWRAACPRRRRPDRGRRRGPCASGIPSTPATTRWSQYGCWIELQMAMPSPSGAARNACGSMANWVTIGKA